jgi:hypothetical protein
MNLDNFKEVFSDSYQEIFQKVLVGLKVANTSLRSGLRYGESVTRIKYDISAVLVRSVTIGQDRPVDPITDSEELLPVNQKWGTTFALSVYERVQAGPLSPAAVIGAKVAHKLAEHIDADILGETVNAFASFDDGDLTTTVSTGTPITLSSTTVPQLVSRAPAKLRANNQTLTNLCFVIDSYAAASMTEYLLGKNIDLAGSTYANGYTGTVSSAEVYVSENLTGEAVLGMATNPTAGDTVSVAGVVFTFRAVPALPGEVDIAGSADATRALLANAINNSEGYAATVGTATTYFEVTAADRAILRNKRIVATNDDTADTLTVVGKGAGRLSVAETLTAVADVWTKNFIHAYFGKKGAIDVVIQDQVDMEMREEPRQRATNILADALYGYKTFTDGSQQFLDVKIKA